MSLFPLYNLPFTVTFANQQVARVLRAVPSANAAMIAGLLGFDKPQPVIFVSGGASGMSEDDQKHTRAIIGEVVRFAEEQGASVIDGGTESGIMKMVGDARSEIGGAFPLVGVAPVGKVSYPG